MSNKISDEGRILTYFETASIDKIEIMFDLVRGIIKKRQPNKKKPKAEKPKGPGFATPSVGERTN
jgi:hypothetical protein